MSVTDNYFICDMNFIGHENEFEQLFSIKQKEIYYFYGDKGIGKRFFTKEFSKFYLKRNNYYLLHNMFTLDYFYFNCFTELMLNEKFYELYFNKIKKFIDEDISYEEDFIDLRWVKTKVELSDYLNEISPIFFKDFMNIERKDGFLVVIEYPDDDILNSNFVEKLQKIYKKFNSVIPITFIITSKLEALNKFKDESLFENVIYKRIKPISDNDVHNYLEDTFEQMQCQVDEEIIDHITYLSNGHPDTMCRLGSACYTYVWKNKDYTIKNTYCHWRNIRKENFYSGLFNYITNPDIINNYFASEKNINELTKFLPILNKLFLEYKLNYNGSFYFNSSKFFNKLSDYEKSIYEDCLTYLIKNHIICSDLEKNVYRLDNLMFLVNSKIIWEYYLETCHSHAH